MINQPNRLPLAQYLRLFELAQDLDAKILEEISIESVEEEIKRQLESILPASHARVGFKTYEDLKREEQAISQILDTIQDEIRPVASKLTPGFVKRLQEEYVEKWNTVHERLKLSDELDKEYRRIGEEEKAALKKKKETLLKAHQVGVSLQSVLNLAEEIKKLEAAEGELRKLQKRWAEEWAALAEQQTDQEKAREYWGKAIVYDNSPEMRDRRDKHITALKALEEQEIRSYEGLLKEAKELYDRATRAPLESLSKPENGLRQALEKCEYIIQALANHPYPSSTCQEAARLKGQISDYNNLVWHSQAIGCIAQAEVDLASDNLGQANENLAHAQKALALIWDSELQLSLSGQVEALQGKIEVKARQRAGHVIAKWRQQAQTYLEGQDAVAALNCIYAAKALARDVVLEDHSQELEALENKALAILSQEVNLDARPLAERAQESFSQGDSLSAFRWLGAALQLDATAILSDSGFRELIDAYFEFQSRRQRLESSLFQAEFRLTHDPRNPDTMLAAEELLSEAKQLLEQLGETSRLQGVDEKINALRQRHREALVGELNGLLQKLEDTWHSRQASPQQMTAILSILKDLAHVLAKVEKARFTVENVKPPLQRAFEYYAQLRSDDELRGSPTSIEGYSLSYMLLSKVSGWETD